MTKVSKLKDAVKSDLFPSAEMVISMSREFGVPLTAQDFEGIRYLLLHSYHFLCNLVNPLSSKLSY